MAPRGERERRGRRGPPTRPLTEPERTREREARRSRAHTELFEVRPAVEAPYLLLRVANPLRGTQYRVHLPTGPDGPEAVCECPDFGQRGLGTCKHIEAARLWISENPSGGTVSPVPVGRPVRWAEALWQAIDGRLAGREWATAPRGRWWRWAGSLLIVPATDPS
ncbi:MAG: hypothetical protein ACRECR_04200 [Thermoplasmata archaeon]